jgi:hypothetical protein
VRHTRFREKLYFQSPRTLLTSNPIRTPNSTPSLKTNWWNYTITMGLRSGVAKIQNPPMAGGTKRLERRKGDVTADHFLV